MSRTGEFVLGLIGGIFGILFALAAMFIGEIEAAFTGSSEIIGLGWSAIAFSVLGIIGSIRVKSNSKLGGWLMIIAAIGGLISISMFYILSFILLLIAGIMGVVRKDKDKTVQV